MLSCFCQTGTAQSRSFDSGSHTVNDVIDKAHVAKYMTSDHAVS